MAACFASNLAGVRAGPRQRSASGLGWRDCAVRRAAKAKSSPTSSPTFLKVRRAAPALAAAQESVSAAPREVELVHHWLHKGGIVSQFAGIDSISAAETLGRPRRRPSPRTARRACRRRSLHRRPHRLHARRSRRREPVRSAKSKTWTGPQGPGHCSSSAARQAKPGSLSRKATSAQDRRGSKACGDGVARGARGFERAGENRKNRGCTIKSPTQTPAASKHHPASAPLASAGADLWAGR